MKKLLLLSIILFSFTQSSIASHMWGGTIYWKCLSNGQYQFYLEVYRDCSGIQFAFGEQEITILGNPLPLNSSNALFSKIVMRPDSVKWLATNLGDISPACDTTNILKQLSCENHDPGTVQQFFYQSDPFTMKGVPPTDGWKFFYESPCCRPGNIQNMQTPGVLTLRAVMYSTINSDPIDHCFYSSPQFISPPTTVICRGDNAYNNIGIQSEGDSISFSWDRPYNGPFESPIPLVYVPGYSPTNPTPDQSFDARNRPSQIDPISGNINLAVYNGSGPLKYINVVQIDSWLNGKIVATTYRELPLSIVDCEPLYDSTLNKKPEVFLNGKKQRNISLDFPAGDKISIPIQVIDSDLRSTNDYQSVVFKPYSQLYSDDFTDSTACDFPPCAVLKNASPAYDSSEIAYLLKGYNSISTTFEWQTNCSQLDRNGKSKTYLFYYKVEDNHCPIPESVSGIIKITLHEKNRFSKPRMNYIFNGSSYKEISWNAQNVSENGFQNWFIYCSSSKSGPYNLLDSIGDFNQQFYQDSSSNHIYYFVSAKSLICTVFPSISQNSDTINGNSNSLTAKINSSAVQLNWIENRSSYAEDEIRKYDIYRSSPKGTPFELIETVSNQSYYEDELESCDETVVYYVEGDSSSASIYYKQDTTEVHFPLYEFNHPITKQNDTLFGNLEGASYQWFDCNNDSIFDGETNPIYLPKDTGYYGVIVSKFGCQDTLICFQVKISRPQGLNFEQLISIFPNPNSSGVLNLEIDQVEANIKLKVINSQGQLVNELSFSNTNSFQIDLPAEAGIYFLEVTNFNGNKAILKVTRY